MLYLNGTWCLADFGIARYAEASTAENTVKYFKTEPYAAPEQWRGERVTPATDVYALGIIAYQMLAGKLPFRGPDFRDQHLHEAPPALSSVSTPLTSLVAQCLLKDPGLRPDAADIVRRLDALREVAPLPGLARLQHANQEAVAERAEAERAASAALTEFERRRRLQDDARQTFAAIGEQMRSALKAAAPAMSQNAVRGVMWTLRLGDASLSLSQPSEVRDAQAAAPLPFVAIATAELTLLGQGSHGYRGRAHSLWFCDLEAEGQFSWYELAFMHQPLIGASSDIDPFVLPPARAAVAFAPVMGAVQLAWQPTRLIPGDLTEFIERWGIWLATAYEGRMAHPSRMPEQDVVRNWRGA